MIIINILSVNSFAEMNCDSQQVDIFNHDQRLSYIWQQMTKKFFFYMEILPAWLVINSSCPMQLPFLNPSLNVSAQGDLKKRLKNEQYQVIVRLLKRFQLISTECSQQRIFKKERPRSFIYISSSHNVVEIVLLGLRRGYFFFYHGWDLGSEVTSFSRINAQISCVDRRNLICNNVLYTKTRKWLPRSSVVMNWEYI